MCICKRSLALETMKSPFSWALRNSLNKSSSLLFSSIFFCSFLRYKYLVYYLMNWIEKFVEHVNKNAKKTLRQACQTFKYVNLDLVLSISIEIHAKRIKVNNITMPSFYSSASSSPLSFFLFSRKWFRSHSFSIVFFFNFCFNNKYLKINKS